MSKKAFKSSASSGRAASGGFNTTFGTGLETSKFGASATPLSYLAEPPDLAAVQDPALVVIFKNLSKKDATTKSKALEELQSAIANTPKSLDVSDEAVLDAWVRTYPRASIEISRRVRLLAHTVHGLVFTTFGKRVARHMPDVVGTWLAGAHDNDKGVMRAAVNALASVFPTEEKRNAVYERYQSHILSFCSTVILEESVQSLSDERTTTREDAEAKFHRVTASCMLLLIELLNKLSAPDIEKSRDSYEVLFGSHKLWDLANASDSGVRRALYKLLAAVASRHDSFPSFQPELAIKSLLSESAVKMQLSSSVEYTNSLLYLFKLDPSLWTSTAVVKLKPLSKIQSMIKQGSQGGSPQFWVNMSRMLSAIPDQLLPTGHESAERLLESTRIGFMRKDETRANTAEGWRTFSFIFGRLLGYLSVDDGQRLRTEVGVPILRQYLSPSSEEQQRNISTAEPHSVISVLLDCPGMLEAALEEWGSLSKSFCDEIKTLAPEQSKSHEASQLKAQGRGQRWFLLEADLIKKLSNSDSEEILNNAAQQIIQTSINQLVQRNGKPTGAAGILEAALRLDSPRIMKFDPIRNTLQEFAQNDLPRLILSPSRSQLIIVLYHMNEQPWFEQSWAQVLSAITDCPDRGMRQSTLLQLLSSSLSPREFTLPRNSAGVQQTILDDTQGALESLHDWSFVNGALRVSPKVTSPKTDEGVFIKMLEGLSIDESQPQALEGLKLFATHRLETVKQFIPTERGQTLLRDLLVLSESSDDRVSSKASQLKSEFESSALVGGDETAVSSVKQMIMNELLKANSDSLSVESLFELACHAINARADTKNDVAVELLPDIDEWYQLLQEFLIQTPANSLAISSLLGDLIHQLPEPSVNPSRNLPRDQFGNASPLRLALYSTSLLQKYEIFATLHINKQAALYKLLLISTQIANDNVSVPTPTGIWYSDTLDGDLRTLDFVAGTQKLLQQWVSTIASPSDILPMNSNSNSISIALNSLLSDLDDSALSFYKARAYSHSTAMAIEIHGLSSTLITESEEIFRSAYKSKSITHIAAMVGGWGIPLSNTSAFSRFCNELIADLTGLKISDQPEQCLQKMILLNLSLPEHDHILEGVAKPRIIRLVQHIITWTGENGASKSIQSQSWRLLSLVLPYVEELYGEHWSDAFSSLKQLWNSIEITQASAQGPKLALVHASLKFLSAIRPIAIADDSNDDLQDAWQDSADGVTRGALRLLTQFGELLTVTNQPLEIVSELLARQTLTLPLEKLDQINSLFALLNSKSEAVQKASFTILHKRIPDLQEQVSFDVAIDKTTARLPEELLSLLVEAPLDDDFDAEDFERNMPQALRSYLSSWILVFDHFKGASDKVKADYRNHIRDGEFSNSLFNFIAGFLGHTEGKPIDASKFEVTTYSFDIVDSPYRDTQWLLMHLWYLSLKYTGSVAKSWWIGCNRQTSQSIEQWTEKNFSNYIIADALTTVSEWDKTQGSTSDETLQVKINLKAKEVVASREVDDQMMAIAVRLPPNYPLGQAEVNGINRVAVTEKKWQSWLYNCSGVIRFTNGSIIDGLISFRRNVNGALKGQTECAICYSIVSSDKQLPTKKCSTCSNLFHGTCLYRWFKSSNSSSCPLCRNPFNYG